MIAEFVSRKMLLMGVAAWMSVAVPVATFSLPTNEMLAQKPDADVHAKGDISGNWQGTLTPPNGKALRTIVKITKSDKGGWGAQFYSIDQGAQPFPVNATTLDGSTVKFVVDVIGGTYTGTLNSDGNAIAGSWTQGATPLSLTLVRATKETAWEIPPPPPPVRMMAADADPAFDVATIKPNDSGETRMQQLTANGRNFTARNVSLGDLMSFAYKVQTKQIVGAPDWLDRDRYDIAGVADTEGQPNQEQGRVMVRKLLADRFKLTIHHEKRDMSAFVLSVGKNGQKLTPNESHGPGPGMGFRPGAGGLTLTVRNGTVADLASLLQALVLDRPVADQTGIAGNFDINVTFTPDDSQFGGHPPPLPAKTDATESAPSLFEAIDKQVGLKLELQKTAVDVIAIDHVEKPSAN